MMHLRYRHDGEEIDIDFLTAADGVAMLAALAGYLRPPETTVESSLAPPSLLPVVTKATANGFTTDIVSVAKPVAETASSIYGRRCQRVAEVVRAGGMVTIADLMTALPGEWPSNPAVWQFLAKWCQSPDCPIERVGRGYYRLKHGGVAAVAPTTFPAGVHTVSGD